MTTEREYREAQERIRKAKQKSQTAPIGIIIIILFAFVLLLGKTSFDRPSDQFQPWKHPEFES